MQRRLGLGNITLKLNTRYRGCSMEKPGKQQQMFVMSILVLFEDWKYLEVNGNHDFNGF